MAKKLTFDEKDWDILRELQRDAKQDYKQISKKTGIPVTTISRRVKRLERDRVIKRKILINPEKAEQEASAIVLLRIHQFPTKGGDNNERHT